MSLATSGLRVRLVRSMVTTLSVVLAIAFLSYSGLNNQLTYNLSYALEKMEREDPFDAAHGRQAADALAQVALFDGLTTDAQRRLARDMGMDDVFEQEIELTRVAELVRSSRIELIEQQKKLTDLMQRLTALDKTDSSDQAAMEDVQDQIPRTEARVKELELALRRAEPREAHLSRTVQLGKWITGNADEDVDDDKAALRLVETLNERQAALFSNVPTPSTFNDRQIANVALLLDRVDTARHGQAVGVIRKVLSQEQRKRSAASLRTRLRRAGIDPTRALTGDPLNTWLIVMALLTCAVGIANAMLMSVTERIREIGTMKCLGASDGLVIKLFLLESCMVGVVGASVGIVLGVIVALFAGVLQFGGFVVAQFPVTQAWTVVAWSVLAGMLLSVTGAVGPAYQAARMRPVDALRVDE